MAVYDEKGLNVVRRHNCMSNVRIGSDGSIIRDGVIVENDGRTIIREDGTIEEITNEQSTFPLSANSATS